MPRKDTIHDAVKNALVKDGWTITHHPYIIKYGDERVLIDLAAELPLAAERDGQQIAVEIKSFIGQSPMNDLENAMGQYIVYTGILSDVDAGRKLYLAISNVVYDQMSQMQVFLRMREVHRLPLLVVRVGSEEIVEWNG